MKLKIGIAILILCFLSCKNKEILTEEKLKNVLFRFAECDALADVKMLEKDSVFLRGCYVNVLKKEGVTKERFEKTMAYYKEKPLQLEAIYDSILNKAITYNLP